MIIQSEMTRQNINRAVVNEIEQYVVVVSVTSQEKAVQVKQLQLEPRRQRFRQLMFGTNQAKMLNTR